MKRKPVLEQLIENSLLLILLELHLLIPITSAAVYVLTSAELNEKFGESQSLSLAQLKQCGAQGMGVGELRDYIQYKLLIPK